MLGCMICSITAITETSYTAVLSLFILQACLQIKMFYGSEMLHACVLCVCQRSVYMNKFHGRISTCLNHAYLWKNVSACSPQNLCTVIKYCNNTKTVKRFWHNWSCIYNVNLSDIWPHVTKTSSVTVTLTGQLNGKQSVQGVNFGLLA